MDALRLVLYVALVYAPIYVPLLALAGFFMWKTKRKQALLRGSYSPERAARFEKGRK